MVGSPLEVLSHANDEGEIGYAGEPGSGVDWPFVAECKIHGWIRYKANRSYRTFETGRWNARHIYEITEAGRQALARARAQREGGND